MEATKQVAVQELIGRIAPRSHITAYSLYSRPSVDPTKVDYTFYDRLRRGKSEGYSIGGLFVPRIGEIMKEYTLGKGVRVEVREDVPNAQTINEGINDFLESNLQIICDWFYDGVTLGDGYVVVNADGTLSQISPDQVTLTHDKADYRKVTKAKITTV
jgi:hypothetical protein